MGLEGRTVLISGATSGLGSHIARQLANSGARIVSVGRSLERMEASQQLWAGSGHISEVIDLADVDAVAPRLREIATKIGPCHALVHSAGLMNVRPLRMLTAEDWDASFRINVASAAALAKGFRQRGVNQEGGSIVFMASVTGLVGHAAQSLYGATKGALIAMARSLAVELAPEKIRVNCVAPAVVEIGMSEKLKAGMTSEQWSKVVALHPLGLGRPEDVANAVNFLVADTGRWITGTTLVVDGGYTAQ